jgi:hypothetical protein
LWVVEKQHSLVLVCFQRVEVEVVIDLEVEEVLHEVMEGVQLQREEEEVI